MTSASGGTTCDYMSPVADWIAVKATAISTGSLKRAAELHGVTHDAVRMRASREKWPVGQRVHAQLKEAQRVVQNQIMAASGGTVTHVTSAADAAIKERAENGEATRDNLMRYARRTSEHVAQLPPELALAEAANVKAVAGVAQIAGSWIAGVAPSVQLSILSVNTSVDL